MESQEDLSVELRNVIGQLRRASSLKYGHSNLKGAEKHILLLVADLKDGKPVTTSEIALKMGVTLAAVTHQINALEKESLIERLQDEDDRRIVFIKLSKKGQTQLIKLKKEFAQRIQKLTDYLGEKDTRSLIHLIKKIANFPGFVK